MRKIYFILTVFFSSVSIQANNIKIGCPTAGQDGSITICDSDTTIIDLFSLITGEQSGGTWIRIAGGGGTFDAVAGTFTTIGFFGTPTTSSFVYTVPGVFPCVDDSSIATITINHQPDAGVDGCISVVDTNPTVIDLYSLITGEDSQGVWIRISGVGGTFSAVLGTFTPAIGAITSSFEYRVVGVFPCTDDSSIATININEGQSGQAVQLICDGANSTATSVAFDWNNVGQTSFNYSYSINGGPIVRGNTIVSNFQVLNVSSGSYVSFTVLPIGNTCFPSTTITCDLLSNSNFESDSVAYYPNPFTDILNLKLPQSNSSIKICNLLGQQVFTKDFYEKDIQTNLSHLSSGTYLVKVTVADSIKTFKIVKN